MYKISKLCILLFSNYNILRTIFLLFLLLHYKIIIFLSMIGSLVSTRFPCSAKRSLFRSVFRSIRDRVLGRFRRCNASGIWIAVRRRDGAKGKRTNRTGLRFSSRVLRQLGFPRDRSVTPRKHTLASLSSSHNGNIGHRIAGSIVKKKGRDTVVKLEKRMS